MAAKALAPTCKSRKAGKRRRWVLVVRTKVGHRKAVRLVEVPFSPRSHVVSRVLACPRPARVTTRTL